MLENYLAYFQHSNINRKEKEQRIHHQIAFWPTSRLKQHWEVLCHSTSGVPIGKGSQAACWLHGRDFRDCSSGFPLIIPGRMQTGIIISLWPDCEPGFLLMLFVLFCKTWKLLSLGWDGWMASLTWWTWVWVSSKNWWWTGKPGVLQSMRSQVVGHDWATELNWSLRLG